MVICNTIQRTLGGEGNCGSSPRHPFGDQSIHRGGGGDLLLGEGALAHEPAAGDGDGNQQRSQDDQAGQGFNQGYARGANPRECLESLLHL